jgi:hypothetical protein
MSLGAGSQANCGLVMASLDQAVFGRFKPQASRSLVRQGARQRMSKRLYQDPMVRTCAGCSKKAEHLTDLGTINKAVWHFQIPQEFTLPPSGRVKRGSHHLIWLVFSWQQSVGHLEKS